MMRQGNGHSVSGVLSWVFLQPQKTHHHKHNLTFFGPTVADDTVTWPGADDGDHIELCWPDGGDKEAIQRSLVVDGTLWTMTQSAMQANVLDGLAVLAQFPLR